MTGEEHGELPTIEITKWRSGLRQRNVDTSRTAQIKTREKIWERECTEKEKDAEELSQSNLNQLISPDDDHSK